MSIRALSFAVCASTLSLALLPAADVDRLASIDQRYYQAVKPTDSELRWQQIPWMQDLAAAAKQAKKEKRPLFLWVSGDEPLDRC
jgi:hypothetical protein